MYSYYKVDQECCRLHGPVDDANLHGAIVTTADETQQRQNKRP